MNITIIMDSIVESDRTLKMGFRWRECGGAMFWNPKDMETRHLFYTLRMIWNHRMPEEAKLHPYKRYSFSAFYTDTYFKMAIKELTTELATRTDLQESWKQDLYKMITYLKGQVEPLLEPADEL